MTKKQGISRRTLIGSGAAVVAAAGLGGRAASAQTKIPPEAVMYVAVTDNEEQFCANCLHWQGEVVEDYSALNPDDPEMAECALVTGELAATGWCGVWAPRA